MSFLKGDILVSDSWKNSEKGYHYVVCLEHDKDGYMQVALLTQAIIGGNVILEKSLYALNPPQEKMMYNDIFVVLRKFKNSESWAPYTKVGKLSKKGVLFIQDYVRNLVPQDLAEYLFNNMIYNPTNASNIFY